MRQMFSETYKNNHKDSPMVTAAGKLQKEFEFRFAPFGSISPCSSIVAALLLPFEWFYGLNSDIVSLRLGFRCSNVLRVAKWLQISVNKNNDFSLCTSVDLRVIVKDKLTRGMCQKVITFLSNKCHGRLNSSWSSRMACHFFYLKPYQSL